MIIKIKWPFFKYYYYIRLLFINCETLGSSFIFSKLLSSTCVKIRKVRPGFPDLFCTIFLAQEMLHAKRIPRA